MTISIKFQRITPSPDPTSKTTPLPRSSHGLSALKNGRLVLYGGENVARTPITEARQSLWIAEKKIDWEWISPHVAEDGVAPSPRVAHAQAAVGDDVYVFGGRGGVEIEETAMNDLWKLEFGAEVDANVRAKWTEVTPAVGSELPEARSFHKMIAVSTDLYVFGGCGTDGRLNDLWRFDTIGKTWTNSGCSHVLKGRGGPNILHLSVDENKTGVKIAIVAGFAGEETNDGHIFNINAWEDQGMDSISEIRKRSVCSFGSLPKHNICIIFGGEVDPSNKGHEGAGNFERDVVVLDGTCGALLEVIKPEQGTDGSSWPEARGWADATVYNGETFYLFGGLSGDDATPVRLNDLWQCEISTA